MTTLRKWGKLAQKFNTPGKLTVKFLTIDIKKLSMLNTIRVNGTDRTVLPEMLGDPLLWVLREDLGLTGPKFGCGQGVCGACTVHKDGAPVRVCLTTCQSVGSRSVITVEGLMQGGKLHPVQRAWAKLRVRRVGFCQAGQMMSAAALLRDVQDPTEAQINQAMASNLCRCGAYDRIRKAI